MDKRLWKAYHKTVSDIESSLDLQPRKRTMPLWLLIPIELIKWAVMLLFIYMFFLVIQLALFNLVIVGIIVVFLKKIWEFLEAFKEKFKFNYCTKDLEKFIQNQQEQVYEELDIECNADREGSWIEFCLKDDEKMFEQEIAARRKKIFEEGNTQAIEEMKNILATYTREKEDRQGGENEDN